MTFLARYSTADTMKPSRSQIRNEIALPEAEEELFSAEGKGQLTFVDINKKRQDSSTTLCAASHQSVQICNNLDLLHYLNHTPAKRRIA